MGARGVSRIVTERIAIRDRGALRSSASTAEIYCTTSSPSATRANRVYWPSSAI
jgi:hypothetical protein